MESEPLPRNTIHFVYLKLELFMSIFLYYFLKYIKRKRRTSDFSESKKGTAITNIHLVRYPFNCLADVIMHWRKNPLVIINFVEMSCSDIFQVHSSVTIFCPLLSISLHYIRWINWIRNEYFIWKKFIFFKFNFLFST